MAEKTGRGGQQGQSGGGTSTRGVLCWCTGRGETGVTVRSGRVVWAGAVLGRWQGCDDEGALRLGAVQEASCSRQHAAPTRCTVHLLLCMHVPVVLLVAAAALALRLRQRRGAQLRRGLLHAVAAAHAGAVQRQAEALHRQHQLRKPLQILLRTTEQKG